MDGNKIFKNCGLWNDQLNLMNNGKGLSIQTPACYIEIEDINQERLGRGITFQNININFHILHTQLNGTNTQLGGTELIDTMDMDLEVFDIRSSVRKNMSGYNPSNCSSLLFSKEKQDSKHNNIYHFITTFRSKYMDTSADPYSNGTYITISAGTWGLNQVEVFVPNISIKGVGYDKVSFTNVVGA